MNYNYCLFYHFEIENLDLNDLFTVNLILQSFKIHFSEIKFGDLFVCGCCNKD
jgi:hypothetical protein